MTNQSLSKSISATFNSSKTFDEFVVKLDLLNIDLDAAQQNYTLHNNNWLKYKEQWKTNDVIDFKKLFSMKHKRQIILPFKFDEVIDYNSFDNRLRMQARIANGINNIVSIYNYATNDNDTFAMYTIDLQREIINTMLDELAITIGNR